jgi:type VI secretion system protein ImpC
MSRKNCEEFLNRWIAQYVLLDDNASQSSKAQYPLREARIEVEEVPGKPGVYRAISYLRPHFQLDEIDVSLRLVAELPAAKG